jgi:hypothetical protein
MILIESFHDIFNQHIEAQSKAEQMSLNQLPYWYDRTMHNAYHTINKYNGITGLNDGATFADKGLTNVSNVYERPLHSKYAFYSKHGIIESKRTPHIYIWNGKTKDYDVHHITADEQNELGMHYGYKHFTHLPKRIADQYEDMPLHPLQQLHRHLNQEIIDHYDNNHVTSSPASIGHLRQYTYESQPLNKALVDASGDYKKLPTDMAEPYEHVKEILQNTPAHTRSFRTYSKLGHELAQHIDAVPIGGKFSSPAFLSSSINPSAAMNFSVGRRHFGVFHIPAGSKPGAYVATASENPDESEYLIAPNTRWRKTKSSTILKNGARVNYIHHFEYDGSK